MIENTCNHLSPKTTSRDHPVPSDAAPQIMYILLKSTVKKHK